MQKTWVRALTTLMVIGMMTLIFIFSMEPADRSDATSGMISETVADLIRPGWRSEPREVREEFYNGLQHIIRKCAHFTEFMLLGISLRLCLESWFGLRSRLISGSWGAGTCYAAFDELHQLLVDGRSGQWTDVLIDSAGVLCGVMLVTGILTLIRRKRRKL